MRAAGRRQQRLYDGARARGGQLPRRRDDGGPRAAVRVRGGGVAAGGRGGLAPGLRQRGPAAAAVRDGEPDLGLGGDRHQPRHGAAPAPGAAQEAGLEAADVDIDMYLDNFIVVVRFGCVSLFIIYFNSKWEC